MPYRFLHSWQDTEPVLCTDFLEMKSLETTCFKTAWDNKLILHQWYSVHSSDLKFTHLTKCQHCFLKNMWYPGSHPDNSDETHLIHQKVTQIVRVIWSTFKSSWSWVLANGIKPRHLLLQHYANVVSTDHQSTICKNKVLMNAHEHDAKLSVYHTMCIMHMKHQLMVATYVHRITAQLLYYMQKIF